MEADHRLEHQWSHSLDLLMKELSAQQHLLQTLQNLVSRRLEWEAVSLVE